MNMTESPALPVSQNIPKNIFDNKKSERQLIYLKKLLKDHESVGLLISPKEAGGENTKNPWKDPFDMFSIPYLP
jgi:hypothetical protein